MSAAPTSFEALVMQQLKDLQASNAELVRLTTEARDQSNAVNTRIDELDTKLFGGLQPGLFKRLEYQVNQTRDRIAKMERARIWSRAWVAGWSAGAAGVVSLLLLGLQMLFGKLGWHLRWS